MLLRKQTHTKTPVSCGLVLILHCFEGKICRTLRFLPPLFKLCWPYGGLSLCCIFLGYVHVLPRTRWRMSEEGSTPKGWDLGQPGKVLVRHPCSHCLLLQSFLLSTFLLQHPYSQSLLPTAQRLIWGLDTGWIYTIHYTHKKVLQVFTVALLFTAHTQAWLSNKSSPVVDNLLKNTAVLTRLATLYFLKQLCLCWPKSGSSKASFGCFQDNRLKRDGQIAFLMLNFHNWFAAYCRLPTTAFLHSRQCSANSPDLL